MNFSIKCFLVFLAGFLLYHPPATAQEDGRFSEKKIKEQELYIEASKFKLLGNLDKATELFLELLKKDRQNDAAAYELARIYADQNNNREALNYAKQAATLDPGNPWYKRFLADVYQRNNLFHEAALIYEELVSSAPSDEFNYYKWAYYLVQDGQTEKALQVYNDLESRIGINEELSRRKHTLYLGIGDAQKAEQELLKLTEAYPDNTDYLHLLAGFYRQMDKPQAAKATYNKILEIDPNDSKAFFALSSMDAPGADESAFLSTLDPVFQNPQVDLDDKIKEIIPYAEKAAATNDQAMARELLRLAAILDRVHPGQAKVCALNGDLLYITGQKEKALQRYRQAVELDETVYSVWEQLFRISLETADYTSLVFYTEKAMDLYPNQAMVYFYNGLGYCRQENYDKGIPSLEQAQLMTGKNIPLKIQVLTQLGMAYQQAGNAGKCDQTFEKALQLSPGNPMVLDGYSFALATRGEALDKALDMIQQANEQLPGNARIEATYGWVLYKQKNYEEALPWFQQALNHGGNSDAVALEHFGDLLYQQEDIDQAVEYWQKALDQGFHSPRLQKKIADRKLYE